MFRRPDWFPTIAAATNIPVPSDVSCDGENFLPLVMGKESLSERSLYWHYPHYGNQGGRPGSAIRHGDWKLIQWYDDGANELYNLARDPGEQNNLRGNDPDRVAELSEELREWLDRVEGVMPTPNQRFDPAKKVQL